MKTDKIYTDTQRTQIISSFRSVKHDSLAGYSIRLFAKTAHEKSDNDILVALKGICDQITDNPSIMMRVLGDQWVYLKHMAFDAYKKSTKCTTTLTPHLAGVSEL